MLLKLCGKSFYEMVTNFLDESSLPLEKDVPYYVLVESMGSDQTKDQDHFEFFTE